MGKCGTDIFLHQEWGITSGESIKVRRNIPKKNNFLDRQNKGHQYPTLFFYCNGCIAYVENMYGNLSYDVASGSKITPCNKICK